MPTRDEPTSEVAPPDVRLTSKGLGLECYLLGVYCFLVYISFLKLQCCMFNVVYEIEYIELQFKNSLRLKALLTLYR